jgi:hypothetical protein
VFEYNEAAKDKYLIDVELLDGGARVMTPGFSKHEFVDSDKESDLSIEDEFEASSQRPN